MSNLRRATAAIAMAAVAGAATVIGSATAATADPVNRTGCVDISGVGSTTVWIYNQCTHTVSASAEVDGWDPDCVNIPGRSTGHVPKDPTDTAYYAYEC